MLQDLSIYYVLLAQYYTQLWKYNGPKNTTLARRSLSFFPVPRQVNNATRRIRLSCCDNSTYVSQSLDIWETSQEKVVSAEAKGLLKFSQKRSKRWGERLEGILSRGNGMCKNLRDTRIVNICGMKSVVVWYCQNMVVRKNRMRYIVRLDRQAGAR